MAPKSARPKLKKFNKSIEKVFKESQVGALLEHIENNIGVIAANQINLGERMGTLETKVDSLEVKIDSLEDRMGAVENRMGSLEAKVGTLEQDMRASFKAITSYLISIENQLAEIKGELKTKADKKDLIVIEQRVAKLELELIECKKMIAAAKNS